MQSPTLFAVAILIAIFIPILAGICLTVLPLISAGAEERAHARRIADARMNARLLRLNL